MGFEKKVQNEIAQVKGLKGGHTSGWFKVLVGTEDKLYLYYPITKLKSCGLTTACKFHKSNVILITDIRYYENKENIQVQLKIPSLSFKVMLDHVASAKPPNIPKIKYYQKIRIHMNADMVLISALK